MKLISTHTVMTSDLGVRGNLFGGQLLAWLDLAAAALAVQVIKSPNVLTVKFSECIFHRPAKINNLIKIYGDVTRIGRTSITLAVEARRRDVVSGSEDLVCSTSVVLVHIDENGMPVEIKEPRIE
jgi:acyl-CoA thioesterase YciA